MNQKETPQQKYKRKNRDKIRQEMGLFGYRNSETTDYFFSLMDKFYWGKQ